MPTWIHYWGDYGQVEEAKRVAFEHARYLGYEPVRVLRFTWPEGEPRPAIRVHLSATRRTGAHRPVQDVELRIDVERRGKRFHPKLVK